MPNGAAISNTSPLLYLHRIQKLEWLPHFFTEVLVPKAVSDEFAEGQRRGYDVPQLANYRWIQIVDTEATLLPEQRRSLGPGETAAIALALVHRDHVVLLDDTAARRTAEAMGLTVWGTLRMLLEAKSAGLTDRVAPVLAQLESSGMWMSEQIKNRILALAGESDA